MDAEQFWKIPVSVATRTDISGDAKILFAYLLDRERRDCKGIGVRLMAEEVGLHYMTVHRLIKALEAVGLVERLADRNVRCLQDANGQGVSSLLTRALADCKQKRMQTANTNIEKKRREKTPHNPPTKQKRPDDWDAACQVMNHDHLRSDAFADAWREWTAYRREKRQTLKPTTVRRQIRFLEGLTHDRAIEAIDISIRNGWTGLFDPEGRLPSQRNNAARIRGGKQKRDDLDASML